MKLEEAITYAIMSDGHGKTTDQIAAAINRNPMLTGTLVYLASFIVWLWTWQALLVWCVFFAIMFVQVLTEEKRLRRDFGEEYETYCRRTGRFLPWTCKK